MFKCKKNKFCSKEMFVPGEKGTLNIILIGEAPGFFETIHKKPFVGKSGKLLRKIIKESGFQDKEINITNSVKCRPENNRTPNIEEIKECVKNNLKEEIKIFLQRNEDKFFLGIGKIGSLVLEEIFLTKITTKKNFISNCFKLEEKNDIKIAFLPHPSYLLRTRSEELTKKTLHLFKKIKTQLHTHE